MSRRFKLYNINMKYIRNLHNVDDNVPSVSPQISKQFERSVIRMEGVGSIKP